MVTLTPVLLKHPPFDAGRDVVPVAMVATSPFMIAVNPGAGVGTLAQLVRLAREQPGKVNVAVVALFSATHLTTELLSAAAGIRLFPVSCNGSPNAVVAAVTGQSEAIVDSVRLKTLKPEEHFSSMGAQAADAAKRRHPGMHRTATFDYAIVLAGDSAASTVKRPGVGRIGHILGGASERERLSTVAATRRTKLSVWT